MMMDCKSMTMLMMMNLKLLGDTSLETVDVTLQRHMIGLLMYLTNTKPNIFFAINTMSQYMADPRHVHLIAAKHVPRYLKGTVDYGLQYVAYYGLRLVGYADSDLADSVTNWKSTSRCCFRLG